jgi:hypothetical protein
MRLPVVRDGRLVGVVARADLLRALVTAVSMNQLCRRACTARRGAPCELADANDHVPLAFAGLKGRFISQRVSHRIDELVMGGAPGISFAHGYRSTMLWEVVGWPRVL